MCTSIIEVVGAEGMAKRGDEWFSLTQAVVAYDHARHAPLGDVITLDFINTGLEPGARAGIELTLEGRVDRAQLGEFRIAAVAGDPATLLQRHVHARVLCLNLGDALGALEQLQVVELRARDGKNDVGGSLGHR